PLEIEELIGPPERLRRPPGDREAGVELPEREVGPGGVRDDREQNAAPPLLRRQVLGTSRFVEPPDAAPHVDFPGEREVDGLEVSGRIQARLDELRLAAARPTSPVLDLGVELRAGDAGARAELLDAPGRRTDVVVAANRVVDQRLERLVAEDFPP